MALPVPLASVTSMTAIGSQGKGGCPGKEVIADGLQYGGANRAHNQKAGAEERVCETAQAFETLKEMLVAPNIL